MAFPYNTLKLDSLEALGVKAGEVSVSRNKNATLALSSAQTIGSTTTLDFNPLEGRLGGAPVSLVAVNRNFTADLVVKTAEFGFSGQNTARKRFTLNDNGLAVCTDKVPEHPLDVYGTARVRGPVVYDTLKNGATSYETKHIFFQFPYIIATCALSGVLSANGIPNDTKCILSCVVTQREAATGLMNGNLNRYAVAWWIRNDGTVQSPQYILEVDRNDPGINTRVYMVCSTTPVDGHEYVPT